MTPTAIRVEVDDAGVATLTLDDPERRNALSVAMVDEMVAAIDGLEADERVGALVVTGAPPAFCAGADLGHLGTTSADGGEAGLRAVYEGFLRIGRSALPTVAAVNGAAVGAGVNLALCCDLRLAGRAARFDARFLQLGLHPGGGHTWLLHRAVGPQAAMAIDVFGARLDGAEAERVGLVWRCIEDGELLDTANAMARRAAEAPRELVRRTKASLRAAPGIADHAAAVDAELVDQLWSARQPAFAERLAALRDKVSSAGRAGGAGG